MIPHENVSIARAEDVTADIASLPYDLATAVAYVMLGVLVPRAGATREYFYSIIVPSDGPWKWLGRRVLEPGLCALYRPSFVYGTTR